MQLIFDRSDLAPLVRAIIAEVLDQFGAPGRLCYPEAEAAAMMGVKSHVLKDARLRGEIQGAKVGRSYSYTRADLLDFIRRRRERGAAK